jgi:hypothetical protein
MLEVVSVVIHVPDVRDVLFLQVYFCKPRCVSNPAFQAPVTAAAEITLAKAARTTVMIEVLIRRRSYGLFVMRTVSP